MEDVAPALWARIQSLFRGLMENDRAASAITVKIENGTATHRDTQRYAERVGEHAAAALKQNLTEDALPDGRLYYNIAARTVRPALAESHALVNSAAGRIQVRLNREAGLGLNAIYPELEEDRVEGILNRLAGEESITDAAWMLDEPVKTLTRSFANSFVKANLDFQHEAGLRPKVTRTVSGNCCAWCAALAGTFDYPHGAPDDIFRQHSYCRCVVTFDPGDGRRQNVHTKAWIDDDEAQAREDTSRILRQSFGASRAGGISDQAFQALRMKRVTAEQVLDAINHPLKATEVRRDKDGNEVLYLTGARAAVTVNTATNSIAAISATTKKQRQALKKR